MIRQPFAALAAVCPSAAAAGAAPSNRGVMTDLVPADRIERIVGARRHRTLHIGRAVSAEQIVYILHSHECVDSGIDLRNCPFSVALDRGINTNNWVGHEDRPVWLGAIHRRLLVVSDLTDDRLGVELIDNGEES